MCPSILLFFLYHSLILFLGHWKHVNIPTGHVGTIEWRRHRQQAHCDCRFAGLSPRQSLSVNAFAVSSFCPARHLPLQGRLSLFTRVAERLQGLERGLPTDSLSALSTWDLSLCQHVPSGALRGDRRGKGRHAQTVSSCCGERTCSRCRESPRIVC